MSGDLLPRVIVHSGEGKPRYSVILLHGLGADGHDFEGIVPELNLPEEMPVRFVFPNAPMIPVTINHGVVMRAWYDVKGPGDNREPDEQGLRASEDHLCRLVEAEIAAGVPCSRIVVAGFSQGGAVALRCGLSYPEKFAGIMALSSAFPDPEALMKKLAGPNGQTPIFLAHGNQEMPLPPAARDQILQRLRDLGCRISWNVYNMGHTVCPQEIGDMRKWLLKVFADR